MVDLSRILPNSGDSPEKRNLKVTAYLFVGVVVLMLLISLLAFTIFFRGAEETLVPNVLQKDVMTGLIELQEKELNPRIQVRYSSEFGQGTIMEQKPVPGTVVKAGRRVNLVVSKGPVIDRVGDYVGQKLEDVKIQLQALFASYRAILKIKEPVMYEYNEAPAGTILAQKPEPGSPLSGSTSLDLVVSKGPRGEVADAGDYVGKTFEETLSQLGMLNTPFIFSVRPAAGAEKRGVVVNQTPAAGAEIPYGSVLQLVMTRPGSLQADEAFGLFEYMLPEYPIMVDLRLEAVTPQERKVLFSMKHPGGPVAIPYRVPDNAELVLYIFDREEIRKPAAQGGG